ncbi:MAG: SDR family oxidoreductase [Gemmatimonadaceae bacterium]
MTTIRLLDTEHGAGLVLVTGATGLLGSMVVRQWTRSADAPRRIAVLVRDPARWAATSRRLMIPDNAIVPIAGDVTQEGLGLTRATREWLARRTTAVVHLAADTTFSRPLEQARLVNRDGTTHLLALAADCPLVQRFAFVSTAFVAGRRTGIISESAESASIPSIGWVNAYEQSKTEAEAMVRAARRDWVILRSSTVACDDVSGAVTQRNAVHQALRLFHDGLAAMIPGVAESMLDVVPADYVAGAVARLALRDGVDGEVVHLCAGAGAMPLADVLDECHARWSRDATWRRRGIALPSLADLPTWELFARTVEETANPRLRRITRALEHFLPQLALPKRFDTARADTLLGVASPSVRDYWRAMIDHLEAAAWNGVPGLVEVAA